MRNIKVNIERKSLKISIQEHLAVIRKQKIYMLFKQTITNWH